MKVFAIVDEFERKVAEFCGSKYAVAVNSGTSALFLSLQYKNLTSTYRGTIHLPARTFISVPMQCILCGYDVEFSDFSWKGTYPLTPLDIHDSALRFRRDMYRGGLECLSFHVRKILGIGEGGMILTDDYDAYKWLKKARYSGKEEPLYRNIDVDMAGWQCYMQPDRASRGLHLMEYLRDDTPDQIVQYDDLREVKFFRDRKCITTEPSTDYPRVAKSTPLQILQDTLKREKTAALMRS